MVLRLTLIIGDPLITCLVNARVSVESGRPDIAKIWEICEHLARQVYVSNNGCFRCNFPNGLHNQYCQDHKAHFPLRTKGKRHPMAAKTLNQVILRLVEGSRVDFQTAAMIICAFTPNRKPTKKYR